MDSPTLETLAENVRVLTDRIHQLEMERADDARKQLDLFAGDYAMRETLLQFTQELAVRDGFSVELFIGRFEAACLWHRDRFLRSIEAIDPHLAAQLDQRALAEIPTEALPPCILPG
jgi:hypothetical protein